MEEQTPEAMLRAIFGEIQPSASTTKRKKISTESYSLLKKALEGTLGSLAEREKQVIEQRFGLGNGYAKSLEEIGKQFKVTRERIRKIEAKALRKMRHPTRIKRVTDQLDATGTKSEGK